MEVLTKTLLPDDNEDLYSNFSDQKKDIVSPSEGSPELNMDNPILQALYSSTTTATSTKNFTAQNNSTVVSENSQTTVENSTQQKASIDPSQIKITPALTSLLDQLLPSLSKSLQVGKKRPKDDLETFPPATKLSRVEPEQLGPGAIHSKPADNVPPPWARNEEQRQYEQKPNFEDFSNPPERHFDNFPTSS